MSVTRRIIDEVRKARFEDIPKPAVNTVRAAVLDDVGIAFLGYSLVGKPLVEYAKDVGGGRQESTIIGDGTKVSCLAAAAVNAQMAYDTDFNEAGPGHHAISLLAQTAISVGDRVGASGKDVLTAVAISYELNGRLQAAASQGARATGLWSKKQLCLSVAMAAGKLLGLTETQLNHAMGVAWFFDPQPSEFLWRNIWWKRLGSFPLGTAFLGTQAALLAQKGFEGPTDVIDRESFYDEAQLLSSPSPYFYPATKLHLKPWICSRGNQTGLQATLELVKEKGIRPADIEEIRVKERKMYQAFPSNNPEPKEYWDAIYSIQWAYAMALLGYEPGRDWLTEERFKDPVCLALARRVKIDEDDRATELYATSKYVTREFDEHPNEVEVVAKGKRYVARKTRLETLGSPANPMTQEHLAKKFKAQASPIIGARQSEELVRILERLEEQRDIRAVTALFGPAAR